MKIWPRHLGTRCSEIRECVVGDGRPCSRGDTRQEVGPIARFSFPVSVSAWPLNLSSLSSVLKTLCVIAVLGSKGTVQCSWI